jgi:hypothetical protein
MQDHLDLGSTPAREACAQLGSDKYQSRARRECRAFINLLRRAMGDEPAGARLAVKSNPHDFGSYLSVVCYFNDSDPVAIDYAYRCESDGPQFWDEQARTDLHLTERRDS